jgi:hypothetical protein
MGEEISPHRGAAVVRVFVSSTWLDLQAERRAVERALARLRETKFVGMEYFGSRDETPLEVSLAELEASDLYLGIVGGHYGSGITEKEYLRAQELRLPCFIYQKPSESSEEDSYPDPRLVAFLAEVGRHLFSTFTSPSDLAAQVTADLHHWLVNKFLKPRLAEVLHGERPSRDAEEILAAVRDLASLDRDLRTRLGQAGFVADSYIDPRPVFERLALDRFTGRLWLTSEVDAFLAENDRGYFLLEADAGLGKTAFLAHLVQERGWVHHFVELTPGQDGVGPGLRNLAAQIALAWRLEPYTSQRFLPAASARPDFLQGLLFEAAKRRDEVAPGEKIVLVVDALDESAPPQGQNVLGLPRMLPQGVYLVISQRPVEVVLATESPRRAFLLNSAEPKNEEDMRAFLSRVACGEAVSALLAESGIASVDFVTTLLHRSRGVWIYLHYVLAEIELGKRRPLHLETLPQGLWGYYFQYWLRRRTNPDWDSLELPLLATLAAIQEEVPARLLCAFAGISETPQVNSLLETWRPFLAVTGTGEQRRYRCYHASFREFLDGRAGQAGPTVGEQMRANELAAATRNAHGRIADRALATWGGFADSLPGLHDPNLRALDNGYALRHLATHLQRAGRLGDLATLLRLEWAREERRENVWYAVHEEERDLAGYLGDVTLLWRSAEAASKEAVSRGEPAVPIVLEISSALLISSVRSLASHVKPALLAALVEKRIWRKEHALAYASQMPDLEDRFLSMVRLIPFLPEPTRSEAISEALVAARELEPESRQKAFQVFPPGLPRVLLEELLKRELASTWKLSETLPPLAAKLPEDLLREALASVLAAKPTAKRTELLVKLVPLAPPVERERLLPLTLEAINHLWEVDRIVALLRLADFLPPPEAERIARQGLKIARKPSDLNSRRTLLLALTVPILQGREQENVAREALEAALASDGHQAEKLSELISRLPQSLLDSTEKRVLKAKSWWSVWTCLIPFAPRWAGQTGKVERALSQLEKEENASVREGLTALAPVLPSGLLERALRLALKIQKIAERAIALAALAPRLSRQQLEEALASVLGSGSGRGGTVRILSNLLAQLATLGRAEESLAKIEQLGWVSTRMLVEVARHLQPEELHRAERLALRFSDEVRCLALAGIAPLKSPRERSRLLAKAESYARWASRLSLEPGPRPDLRLAIALARTGPDKQQALRKVLAEIPPWAKEQLFSDLPVAELLDILVPHLEAPLLREALALAGPLHEKLYSMYEVRKLPRILRAILPRLPETLVTEVLLVVPDELSPSLAQPQPESDTAFPRESRAIRLSGLLPRLSRWLWSLLPRRVRYSEFALDLAKENVHFLPSKTLRARVLVALAVASESTRRNPSFSRAAEASLSIASPALRAEALTALLSLYPDPELAYLALAAGLAIAEPTARADALDALAPHLHPYLAARSRRTADSLRRAGPPGEPTEAEALEMLREAASTSGVLRCLDRLSPENREPLLRQALEIVGELDEQTTLGAWTLLQLVPYLPTDKGVESVQFEIGKFHSSAVAHMVAEWGTRTSPLPEPIAQELLASIHWSSSRDQSLPDILTIAAPHLPDSVLAAEVEKIWSLDDLANRTRALSALAPRLASLPAPLLLPIWQEVLRQAAKGKREEVIAALEGLLPVIERLGGEETLEGIWHVLVNPGASLP